MQAAKAHSAYPASNGGGYSNGASTGNGYIAAGSYGATPAAGNYNLSADEYRKKHDLTIVGDNCPDPIQEFSAAGFTPDILDEVPPAKLSPHMGWSHPCSATHYSYPSYLCRPLILWGCLRFRRPCYPARRNLLGSRVIMRQLCISERTPWMFSIHRAPGPTNL